MLRRWFSALALGLAAVLAVAACSESGDPNTATSTSIDGAARDEPGALLATTAVDVDDVPGEVWSIRYRSVGIAGEPVEISGLVAVPSSAPPNEGYPILSFGHGTKGIADQCAPAGPDGDFAAGFRRFLEEGWVVALTDYEGLGTPGMHPYLVSVSEGRSVLDAARAAREVAPETGDRVVLSGHSQGGHASLAAAEIARSWAPELDLRGTIAVAPAADVEAMFERLLQDPGYRALAVLIGASWGSVYDDLDARGILDEEGLEYVDRAARDVCSTEILSGLDPTAALIDVEDQEALGRWRARAEENSIDPGAVQGPVLVAQGTADFILPPQLARNLVDDLCAAGVEVELQEYAADHVGVYAAAEDDLLDWAAARLTGARVETSCE